MKKILFFLISGAVPILGHAQMMGKQFNLDDPVEVGILFIIFSTVLISIVVWISGAIKKIKMKKFFIWVGVIIIEIFLFEYLIVPCF